jgi:phosphoesterase RecJ-like protein
MSEALKTAVEAADSIVVIQAENPDGDSLGSSLALEEILGDLGKKVQMYCHVDIPKYLRHMDGWSRVTDEFPFEADMAIIVDTLSDTLLSKALGTSGVRHWLETHPVIAIDHHASVEDTLSFSHETIADGDSVATGQTITHLAEKLDWKINSTAASYLYSSIMADSLGLTTDGTTADSIHTAARLVEYGAVPAQIEAGRRELMKKSAEILTYKGQLLQRIDYFCDGRLALVHIPWEDIEAYSDQYNPSMLVLDEMRLVSGVEIAVALKTYPDGKITGKLRTNAPVADKVAGYFGGGGHAYASGFRVFESYDVVRSELVTATLKILEDLKNDQVS